MAGQAYWSAHRRADQARHDEHEADAAAYRADYGAAAHFAETADRHRWQAARDADFARHEDHVARWDYWHVGWGYRALRSSNIPKETGMIVSRRSLLAAGGAALVATAAGARIPPSAYVTRKKGLAGAAPATSGLRTGWYYDWGVGPSGKGMPTLDPGMRFLPMVWGLNDRTAGAVAALRTQRPPVLFGFNEPDHHDQSNLTVEQALDAWPMLEGVARELVAPSCAQPHQQWMQRFVEGAEQRKLHFDAVGFHHYGSADPHDLIGLLTRVHDMYRKPIWVTEFGCVDWGAHGGRRNRYTEREAVRFIEAVCPFMERTDWVRGYAWYPWGKAGGGGPLSASAFFTPEGTLTDAGAAYAAV